MFSKNANEVALSAQHETFKAALQALDAPKHHESQSVNTKQVQCGCRHPYLHITILIKMNCAWH